MKRFIVVAALAILLHGALGILKADEPVKPSDIRSYTQGFMPQLGGAYRNPDAYLPYYPGYCALLAIGSGVSVWIFDVFLSIRV